MSGLSANSFEQHSLSCSVQSIASSMPVISSVSQLRIGSLVWIFVEADNRNKLFHELENAQQQLAQQKNELELMAHTDLLTGIKNRRALDDAMVRSFNTYGFDNIKLIREISQ